jgi:hypothetical protein
MLLQDKTQPVIIISEVAEKTLTAYIFEVFHGLSQGHLMPGPFEVRKYYLRRAKKITKVDPGSYGISGYGTKGRSRTSVSVELPPCEGSRKNIIKDKQVKAVF